MTNNIDSMANKRTIINKIVILYISDNRIQIPAYCLNILDANIVLFNFIFNILPKRFFATISMKIKEFKWVPANYINIGVNNMLIDTSIVLAYKCSSCGTYSFFDVSFFGITSGKKQTLKCKCGKTCTSIKKYNSFIYNISISCIACGDVHIFSLDRKQMLSRRGANTIYCPKTNVPLCFIGNDNDVRKKVDVLEKELDDLISKYGYDNYFRNTQVMFDSLNRIHDLAEQGNLFCECGSTEIQMFLFSDKIFLKCEICSASKVVYAASNQDLKRILLKRQILLCK